MALSRILILKLSSLGDVIHSLPVAGALRRRFPRCEVSWLVGPAASGVVGLCRHVSRMLVWPGARRGRLRALHELRDIRPQVALDLQGLFRSAALAWLSGARWRVGFRSWQEGAFPLCNLRVVAPRTDIHAVDAYLGFARYLGANGASPDFGLGLPRWAREQALRALGAGGAQPLVALLPGTRWPSKQWPVRHFAELATALGSVGARCVVLGGGEDRAAGAMISSAAPGSTRDLTGRASLVESAAIIARCALAVGNDSGPTHLAAALGVPVVALFGPTDPVRTGPYGTGHVVLRAPVPCVGCRRRRCAFPCMETLAPQSVFSAVRQKLNL